MSQHVQSAFVSGRGLHATTDIFVPGDSAPRNITAGIDTLSDVNLARRDLMHGIHGIDNEAVRGTGGTSVFREQGYLRVSLQGSPVEIPVWAADSSRLPRGCDAIFGMPAISDLGVDLSAQNEFPDAPLQCFLQEVPDTADLQCFLGERALREWLDANEGASVDTKPFDLSAIEINPELPPKIIDRVKEIIRQYSSVFGSSSGNLPKPFDTEPVELNFRGDFQPQTIPEPRWTHAQAKILTKHAEDGLANGSLEFSKSPGLRDLILFLRPLQDSVLKMPASPAVNFVSVATTGW